MNLRYWKRKNKQTWTKLKAAVKHHRRWTRRRMLIKAFVIDQEINGFWHDQVVFGIPEAQRRAGIVQ